MRISIYCKYCINNIALRLAYIFSITPENFKMCLFIFTCDEMLKMELKCSPRLATEFFLDLFPLRGAGLQILMLLSVFLANFRVLGLGCGLLKVAKMKTFQYISRPIFFAISFSGKSWGLFCGRTRFNFCDRFSILYFFKQTETFSEHRSKGF